MTGGTAGRPLLQVRDLRTYFDTRDGVVRAVDGVSFDLSAGETLGIVGESGSGKSILSRSILRLVQTPPGRYAGGEISFMGEDILAMPPAAVRSVRGDRISMIFQEPMSSLNPVLTIGYQIAEVMRVHRGLGKAEARRLTVEMLRRVRIPDPDRRFDEYPYQLSGGMRQRVMIAIALACQPSLLIADEPTTALDVTIQAQILRLMRDLQREMGTAMILITHDLGVVAEVADRVMVMYAGRVVEHGRVADIFANPSHPYTRGLLASIPRMDETSDRLEAIEGTVPRASDYPPGCRFHPRCPAAFDRCARELPPDIAAGPDHAAACWLLDPHRAAVQRAP